jgi:hypothetical protein
MSLSQSLRGQKDTEGLHYRQNLIAKYVIDEDLANPMGPGTTINRYEPGFGVNTLAQQLHAAPHRPLLWTYADQGNRVPGKLRQEIIFGYDLPVGGGDKAGHAALTGLATIAGEIHSWRLGANSWIIGNQSGAWGAMPALGMQGKSGKLQTVAMCMTNHLGLMVRCHEAVSASNQRQREFQLGVQLTQQGLMNFVRKIL